MTKRWTEREAVTRAALICYDRETGYFDDERFGHLLYQSNIFPDRQPADSQEIRDAATKAFACTEQGRLVCFDLDVLCRELRCGFLYMPTAADVARSFDE